MGNRLQASFGSVAGLGMPTSVKSIHFDESVKAGDEGLIEGKIEEEEEGNVDGHGKHHKKGVGEVEEEKEEEKEEEEEEGEEGDDEDTRLARRERRESIIRHRKFSAEFVNIGASKIVFIADEDLQVGSGVRDLRFRVQVSGFRVLVPGSRSEDQG